MDEKFKRVVEKFKEITKKECYRVAIVDGNPSILDNKIGGKPYLPIGEEYPKDLSVIMQMLINRGTYQGIKVYEPETIELMFIKNWEGHTDGYYAKGLQMAIMEVDGYKLYGHFGSAYGVRSFMFFDKDKKEGMCFICNGLMNHSYTDGNPNVHLRMFDILTK